MVLQGVDNRSDYSTNVDAADAVASAPEEGRAVVDVLVCWVVDGGL